MVRSMTGYGTGFSSAGGIAVSAEVRSGNHRYLDTHIRLGREYAFLEPGIALQVRKALSRGRVDVSVAIQETEIPTVSLNTQTAMGYVEAVGRLRDELGLRGELELQTLLLLPGVLPGREAGAGPTQAQKEVYADLVREAVDRALAEVRAMRGREGVALGAEMLAYAASVGAKADEIRAGVPDEINEYRRRLEEKLGDLGNPIQIDPQRLAMEVALLADKADITEELTRLDSHLKQFAELARTEEEVGKKLDFLLQEMQREVNTILAKTGKLETKRLGIEVKADIEKLREQVQNVE